LEGQLARRVGIRLLLKRQLNVESDRWSIDVGCAAIGRLHEARAATGRDDIVTLAVDRGEGAPALGGDPAEAACLVVPVRHMRSGASSARIRRRGLVAAIGWPDTGTAEDNDRGLNAPKAQLLFGLGKLQHKADALHGVAQEEVHIRCGQAVGGGKLLRLVVGHWSPPDFQSDAARRTTTGHRPRSRVTSLKAR
jgi:hypothetical protein